MGRLRRALFALTALASAGAVAGMAAPIVLSVRQLAGTAGEVRVVNASNDVGSSWNYTCFDNSCPAKPDNKPVIRSTLTFDATAATSSYRSITKWADYQRAEIKNTPAYDAVIPDDATFNNYYLEPHTAATGDLQLWKNIYSSIDGVLRPKYLASVTAAINSLLSTYVKGSLTFTGLTPSYPSNSFGVTTDFAGFGAAITKDKVLTDAKAFDSVYADLIAGRTAPTDLTASLTKAFASQAAAVLANNTSNVAAATAQVQTQFDFTASKKPLLDSASSQKEWDDSMAALVSFADQLSSLSGQLSATQRAAFGFVLGAKWTAADFASAMTDDNLTLRLADSTYVNPTNPTADQVAAAVARYQKVIHQLDTIYKANLYAPSGVPPRGSYVGPYYAASIVDSLVNALNIGHVASSTNPSLLELVARLQDLKDSGLFTGEDLANFSTAALADLLNDRPVSEDLQKLIDKALADKQASDEVKAALDAIKKQGLSAQALADLLNNLRSFLDTSSLIARYVFIALGGVVGLISAFAGYAVIRGYLAKRKYGTTLAEYAMSKKALTAVAVTALVVAAVLIAITAAGAV